MYDWYNFCDLCGSMVTIVGDEFSPHFGLEDVGCCRLGDHVYEQETAENILQQLAEDSLTTRAKESALVTTNLVIYVLIILSLSFCVFYGSDDKTFSFSRFGL